MPIYEYKCNNCDHRLEKLQKISDDPIKTCPECEKDTLVKLVSAAAFKLKGTGWYETDFKDKKPKKDEKKTSTTSKDTKTSKTDETKASKPAKSSSTTTKKET